MKSLDFRRDRDIIERSKQNSRYFALLYRRYESKVFYFFYRRVSSADIAKDLTQETFMRAFRSRHDFVYRGYPYSAYLFRIARNLLVNYYKKKKTLSLEKMDYDPSFSPSYDQGFEINAVWKATRDLLPTEQKVLIEKYKKGKKIKEIAKEMNKSENAVKLLLSRARKKLRKHPLVRDTDFGSLY